MLLLCWCSELNQLSKQPERKSWYQRAGREHLGAQSGSSGSRGPLAELYLYLLKQYFIKIFMKVILERSLGSWILGFNYLILEV